jgi:hypothetical protein
MEHMFDLLPITSTSCTQGYTFYQTLLDNNLRGEIPLAGKGGALISSVGL